MFLQKAKSEAMREKMKSMEGDKEALKCRAIKAEEEIKVLQKKFKTSNEAKTAYELNIVKHELEQMKLKLQREMSEKEQLVSQRDEYRQAAHKLVSD